MKKDLIIVKATAISITADFDAAREYIQKELKKYEVVVTEETIAGCKKLGADLNKVAGEIDKKRKAELSVMTAPIKTFDAGMKSLVTLCKEGREKITKQIKVFDDARLLQVESLLKSLRERLWHDNKVSDDFKSAEFDDLILQGSMTATGKLTAKAITGVTVRVGEDMQKQKDVEMRLVKLENACYKAGLKTPLTEVHVKAFLNAEDDVYCNQLELLIKAELNRQTESEEIIRQQLIKEAAVVVDEAVDVYATEPESPIEKPEVTFTKEAEKPDPVVQVSGIKVEKPVAPSGKVTYVLIAKFEITVPTQVTSERVRTLLEKKIVDAGITSLKEMTVVA